MIFLISTEVVRVHRESGQSVPMSCDIECLRQFDLT